MQLLTIGINHHTAPVALRERVAFPLEQIKPALGALKDIWLGPLAKVSPEAAILSTCNRTELYCATDDQAAREAAIQWLSKYHNLPVSELAPHVYALPQSEAVRHAFRVASGLDSMVLGETQIVGQMKDAVRTASEAGALGTYLNQLFQRTFAVAKEVRTTTEIGAQSVSMAAAAVRLAQRIFENISSQRVLFIGAGEMIELCATHFAAQNPRELVVANRTAERGEKLAGRFNGRAIPLSELPARMHEFDIIVSCTASTLPIIGLGAVERAVSARRHRPIFMVDLAVPRDIEPEVGKLARRVPLHRRRPRRDRARRQRVASGRGRAGRSDHRDARAEFHAMARRAQHRAGDPPHAHAGRRAAPRRSRTRAQDARARRRPGRRARSAVAIAHEQADSRPDARAQPREPREPRPAHRPDERLLHATVRSSDSSER